jgi:large subunit ribosomal protein L24
MSKLKIKKGDEVKVVTGKDKGKIGTVLKVFPKEFRLLVSGVNLAKKHTKPTQFDDGGIVQKELPIHISNVAYFDKSSNQATKIGYTIVDGVKNRLSKKSKLVISEVK